jgi:hypothetical protein
MLEYLFYPVLYRTQLDPTTKDCEFSQMGLVECDDVYHIVQLRQNKVYIDDQCIFTLPQACGIALATYNMRYGSRKYDPNHYFYLLASDMTGYYLSFGNKLRLYSDRISLPSNKEDALTSYLRYYKAPVK